MLRIILVIATASLVMATPLWAADDVDTETSGVGGTVPELAQIVVTSDALGSLLTVTQDGTGEPAYDAGYIESAADALVLTLDANKQWQLSVKYQAEWTDPAGYDKEESDLTLRITSYDTGTIQNSWDSYQSPGSTNSIMLSHGSGVSNNVVDIQGKVLLSWIEDIPGVYSITIVYTMETTT